MVFGFTDGTSQTNTLSIATAKYHANVLKHPVVSQSFTQLHTAAPLSYSFVMLKTTDLDPTRHHRHGR